MSVYSLCCNNYVEFLYKMPNPLTVTIRERIENAFQLNSRVAERERARLAQMLTQLPNLGSEEVRAIHEQLRRFVPTLSEIPLQQHNPRNGGRSNDSLAGATASLSYAEIDRRNREYEHNFQIEHSASRSEQLRSAKASVIRLQSRYSTWNRQKQLTSLKRYLKNAKNEKAQKAEECLEYIKNADYYPLDDGKTTLLDVLTLMWYAAHTLDAPPPDLKVPIDENFISMREESLMDKLYEALTTYPNRGGFSGAACLKGIFTKIVSALNHAHQDVEVINGLLSKDEATESAIYWIKKAFTQRSVSEQKQIWLTWEKEGDNAASQFRSDMKIFVSNELERVYGTFLHSDITKEITSNFDYLPRPELHQQWEQICQTINGTEADVLIPYDADLLVYLQAQMIVDNGQTWEEESERLNALYQCYLTYKSKTSPGRILVDQIHNYMASNKVESSEIHSKAIENIKAQIVAPQNLLSPDISASEKLWKEFKAFEESTKEFSALNVINNNQSNQRIIRIGQRVNKIYDDYQHFPETKIINAEVMELKKDIEALNVDIQSVVSRKRKFSISGFQLFSQKNNRRNDSKLALDSAATIPSLATTSSPPR